MKIKKFIQECSFINAPLGDLAQDMLNDNELPINGTNEEIYAYMDFIEKCDGAQRAWTEFKKLYNEHIPNK